MMPLEIYVMSKIDNRAMKRLEMRIFLSSVFWFSLTIFSFFSSILEDCVIRASIMGNN